MTLGIIGSICIGAVGLWSMAWIPIGPVLSSGGCLGITVNAQLSVSFDSAGEAARRLADQNSSVPVSFWDACGS